MTRVKANCCKAAEFQARGVIHLHAVFRLDGTDPDTHETIYPPAGFTRRPERRDPLRRAWHRVHHPPHPARSCGWRVAWGDAVLSRHPGHPQRGPARSPTPCRGLPRQVRHQVHRDHRPHLRPAHPRHDRLYANAHGTHAGRLIEACWELGHTPSGTACAAGRTCSASAGTSSPSPAATRSPSTPARHPRVCRRTVDTDQPAGTDGETTLVVGLLNTSAPDGAPPATPCSPTPPPPWPEPTETPLARNWPTSSQ